RRDQRPRALPQRAGHAAPLQAVASHREPARSGFADAAGADSGRRAVAATVARQAVASLAIASLAIASTPLVLRAMTIVNSERGDVFHWRSTCKVPGSRMSRR